MINKIVGKLIEVTVVVAGSIAAGILIGVLQHYVAFGVWGDGFGREAIELALFEGGIAGGMAGIPTGLVTYYWCLGGRVSIGQVVVIVGGSLLGGCCSGMVFGWPSAFFTPLLTILVAIGARVRASATQGRRP